MGFCSSGSTRPASRARCRRSCVGRSYPSTSSAVSTAWRVASETPGFSFSTRLTVASLTFAYAATSASRRVMQANVIGFADRAEFCSRCVGFLRDLSGALRLHASSDVVLRHRRAPPRSVTRGHCTQYLVAASVVVLRLEEDDRERRVGLGVVEQDDLRRRESLRWLPVFHLAVHLLHPLFVDAFECHNTCECHTALPLD